MTDPAQIINLWWRGWQSLKWIIPRLFFSCLFIALVTYNVILVNFMVTELNMNDFGQQYYAVQLFLQGQDMYGPNPATLKIVSTSMYEHFWNLNPPVYHIFLLPLAPLPIGIAFALWMGLSLLSLIISLRIIFQQLGIQLNYRRVFWLVLGLISFVGTSAVLATGELSLLLLLPITLAWREARQDRWKVAGIYLGICLSIKLFMLIFLPYLILRRKFQAVATMVVVVIISSLIGLLVFGKASYHSWFWALSSVHWEWAPMNASVLGVLVRSLSESPSLTPLVLAPDFIKPSWLVIVGFIGFITIMTSTYDSSLQAIDRGFALLLTSSLLISPLGWAYYLWLPLAPIAALIAGRYQQDSQEQNNTILSSRNFRNFLWVIAVPWLVWPLAALLLFQPHPWATVIIGSAYFWGTLLLWVNLLADWVAAKKMLVR